MMPIFVTHADPAGAGVRHAAVIRESVTSFDTPTQEVEIVLATRETAHIKRCMCALESVVLVMNSELMTQSPVILRNVSGLC